MFQVESNELKLSNEILKSVLGTVGTTFESHIQNPANRDSKDGEKAREFREAGNKAYSAKKFGPAVGLYTKSLAHAPVGSEALALAYANRSAVLVQMKKYRSALQVLIKTVVSCNHLLHQFLRLYLKHF